MPSVLRDNTNSPDPMSVTTAQSALHVQLRIHLPFHVLKVSMLMTSIRCLASGANLAISVRLSMIILSAEQDSTLWQAVLIAILFHLE